MPYESEKLKSRVFYYLCMVLAGCILANIVLRCDRDLQVFILPFTDSSRLAGGIRAADVVLCVVTADETGGCCVPAV